MKLNKLYNLDCMEGMKEFPDKYFNLAIVDPPYGIGLDKGCNKGTIGKYGNKHIPKEWDKNIPDINYFKEIFRISENLIIWGANYFTNYLPPSKSWIIWDKKQPAKNFASCELAWTNINNRMNIYSKSFNIDKNKIHPTQKPITLYKWLLNNYAKSTDKIIDTHAGSCSSVIAFLDFGCDWIAFEIDEDYYKDAMKRIENHKIQLRINYENIVK